MEWKGIKGTVLQGVPMKRYTSMKVGGHAAYLIYPLDEADLTKVLQQVKERDIKYRFLGNGTNVIVSDRGINEALIRITKMKHIRYTKTKTGAVSRCIGRRITSYLHQRCGRKRFIGTRKALLDSRYSGRRIKMNAGSFGQSISDTLKDMRIIDAKGNIALLEKNPSRFGYRDSPVRASDCIISARFAP